MFLFRYKSKKIAKIFFFKLICSYSDKSYSSIFFYCNFCSHYHNLYTIVPTFGLITIYWGNIFKCKLLYNLYEYLALFSSNLFRI